MTAPDEIDILILDYFGDTLTEEGGRKLQGWIDSSDENKNYFASAIAYLETTVSVDSHHYSSGKAWKKIRRKINPRLTRRQFFLEAGKLAAAIVLAFMAGYGFLYFRNEQKDNKEAHNFVVTEVPYGSKSVVSLPDGSRVWINAGSKMTYPADFSKKDRIVRLEGEAYFDIVTNKDMPFYVESYGIRIKATGTLFNVRAYRDEEFIETTLVEGKISVIKGVNEYGNEIALHPNQKLTIYKGGVNLSVHAAKEPNPPRIHEAGKGKSPQVTKIELESNVSTAVYTSWKDKEWVIFKEKFGSLARKLERRYDVQIFFNEDFLKDFSYTGTLQDENLREVLDVMSVTSPICYKLEDKTVKICYNPSFNEKRLNE